MAESGDSGSFWGDALIALAEMSKKQPVQPSNVGGGGTGGAGGGQQPFNLGQLLPQPRRGPRSRDRSCLRSFPRPTLVPYWSET